MKSEEIIIAKSDVSELHKEVLSKSSDEQKKIAELMVTAFLLGCNNANSNTENKTAQPNSGKAERWVKPMEIIIKAEPKEIADLVLAIQNRHSESFKMKAEIKPKAVYGAIRDMNTAYAELKTN